MPIQNDKILKAVQSLKQAEGSPRKFTQSVDLSVNIQNVDLKKPENRIREVVNLPYAPKGKSIKICVIADGDMGVKAKQAGADLVLGRADVEKLTGDKKAAKKLASSYDFFLARVDLMPVFGKALGQTLAPKGKMADPVPPTADIATIINRYKKSVRVRIRDQPLIHCRIGTEAMEDKELTDNIAAVLSTIEGKFKTSKALRSVYVKKTMGAPIKVEL